MFTSKIIRNLLKVTILVVFSLLFMTCDPGLGKAVDTQAPKVSVSFPVTKSVLKGGFMMKGVASDEVKVESCVVTFRNMDTSDEYNFTASVTKGEFSVNINSPESDGSFELPDGDYNVTVTVSDAYRISTADVVYTIDNTAPTVLLTSPNVYVASNWPSMYKLFTIKGEVYDFTNIEEVKVYIVDSDGNVLAEKVAEGTNTFLASFENPNIPTGKTCFYYAVAKDAGGNENTYCYHKQDIYALLSQQQKSSTFPSINAIGYVDQKVRENFNDSIDNELLGTKKIENKNPSSEKGSRPGFDFFDKDTAKIQWLNISEDGESSIGIGSPVIGTIMPPTDGSSVLDVEVWVAKETSMDVFEEYSDENKIETDWGETVDGSTVYEGQCELKQVGDSVNFQINSHDVGSGDNWPSSKYKVKVKFITNSDMEGYAECVFEVASGAPKVTEGNFSPNPNASYYRGFMTAQTLDSGKNYLKGISKTSDEANQVSLSYEISGSSIAIENAQMDGNGNYEIQVPIDAVNHTKDGEHTYTLTAKGAELTTVISRVIVIDTTNPVVNFTNLTNEQVVPSKDFVVRGNVEDTNGISKVEYQLFADGTQILLDGTSTSSGWIVLPGINGAFDLSLTNLKKDVNYELKIRTTDAAGNVTGEEDFKRQFTLDNTNPEIKINSVSPQIEYKGKDTVNGNITVNLSVTDTNTIKEFYYTFDNSVADDSNWSAQGNKVKLFDSTSGVQKLEIDTTDYSDGSELPLRIKAVDEAGNGSVVKVNPVVNQESDKPMITPSNFSELNNIEDAGWQGSNTENVFGTSNPNMIFTVADDDLVKEYYAKVNDNPYQKVGDVNSAQKIVTFSVKDLTYKRYTVTLKIIDENYVSDSSTPNNFVEEVFYIAIDDGQPTLTLNNASGQFVGKEFTLSGKAEDGNGIDYVTLQAESGNVYESLVGSGLDDGKFSYTFKLDNLTTKEPIIVTAVDKIGNSISTKFTYLVDSTPPTVNFDRNEVGYVDGDSPSLRLQGTAVDGEKSGDDNDVSKIDQVRLRIGSPVESINDENSILATGKVDDAGKMIWTALLDFTDFTAGKYTVYAAAFDFAGNMSEVQDSVEIPVDADTPKIESSYVQDVSNSPILISGQASDNSGIKSVSAKVQGSQKDIVVNYNQTSDETPSDWSFYVPTDAGQGQLTIVVTATDVCGKSTNETFVAVIDTEVPEVTFTDISDDDSNNETIETSKTNDKPSVSVTYSDKTSGVKTLAYEFYYFDRTKGEFVNYATKDKYAAGTFTRNGSFSGSVKLRMAEQTTVDSGAFIYPDTYTDGKWFVKVTVTDVAENEATYNSPYFYVDQHKPTLDVTSPADLSLKKQNDALTVSGSTSDNFNGEIDKVVVKVTHPNYNQSQLDQFTKTFTKDGSNGTQLLTQIGSDEKYSFEYTWDESNSPFKFPNEYEVSILTYDKAGNETPVTRKVSCDSTAPTISFSRPYSYSVDAYGNVTKGSVVNSPIGDTSIKALANDYSMDSIYYQVGGTVKIESTGTLGQSDYKIKKLTVTDGGVGTDDYGTSYTNPSSDNLAAGVLVGVWNKLTVANFDFDVSYNTLTFNNSGKTYHVDGDKETIMTLDVHFVAVDEAGNVNYCKMPIKVDTDTDKPNLLILSPQTINDVANVGGTATISGTVNDDNSVHSVWMQVELVNGNYQDSVLSGTGIKYLGSDYVSNPQYLVDNNDGTYSIGDANTYFTDKSKWYKVNLGAENSKSTTWNMVLNKNKEFDNKSLYENGYLSKEVAQTELIVRVRALDTKSGNSNVSSDAKLGDVSEFTLKIDSGSPSIIINNFDGFPTEGSYIGGDLVFDVDFSDDDSITEWKIEALSAASGDNRSLTIGYGKYSGSFEDGLGKTISVKETVDTEDIYRACGNVIQIKISAKDNSKNSNSDLPDEKETYLTFKYVIDNSAPQANYVDDTYRISTESVDGSDIRESEARNSHLRILSDQAAFIGNVKDEDNGSGVDYVMLYFTKDGYLYNPSQNNVKESLSNKVYLHDENGNQVEVDFPVSSLNDIARTPSSNGGKVTPYIVIDRAEGMNDSGSNGDLDGYDENLKANGDWVVYIKSSNLPDGVYDIHYVIVDQAKNARYYHDSMFVQNNAPKITSIVLATDIDGDGEASIGSADKGDEYEKFSGNYETTGFKVRNNKLKVKVNVTGGTGTLKYFLTYPTKDGSITTDSNNTGYKTGVFDVTEFKGDDGGNYVDYVVWVEDSVEEQLSLSSGKTTIDMIMDNVDDINPVAQFFELNTIVENSSVSNSNRGSLYKDGSVKGHIETRQNSPVDNVSEQDPDVSGTIILRGEVLDNQRIESIVLRLNDTNVTIAKWNPNLSLLELKDANAKIYDSLGLLGHYVEWQYAWDTNSFAKYDTDVKVIVTDSAGKVSGNKDYSSDNTPRTESNKFTLDNWGYNSMTVDVVPYITGLGTTLSRIEKRNPSVYGRSTLGKYPVYYYRKTVSEGKESEEITVEGFNILSGSTVTFEGGATTSLDVNKVFTLPENAKSGKIFVTVSEVPSLNNANDNGAVGSSGEYYNQKPNGQNNDLLTDDIELLIWEINSKAAMSKTGELSEVMMHVNPANGMVGFAFAHSQDLASYPKGNESSYQTWMTDWTGVNQIGFVYDQKGNMYGTNGGTDTYTPSKKTGRLGLISSHWGIIADDSKNGDWYTGYTKYHRLRLEYLGMTRNGTYASNVYRFAKGDSTQLATTYSDAKGTNLYMLYYDNTLGELKFKAGNFGNAPTDPSSSASGEVFSQSGVKFGDFADDAFNQSDNSNGTNYSPNYKTISIVANQNGAKGNSNAKPGIYYSVDAIYSSRDQSDVVVAVWYDDVNKTLWYSYLVNPLANAGNRNTNGAISTEWATPIAILDGHAGGYNAIKVDDAGHIHIAAYSRNDAGSLYYAYLNSYDADYNENENLVAVDAYGSTGQYITMEVANNGKGKYIPYIGYYMSSMSYPKYAYLVDTESAKAGDTYYPKPGVDENSMFTGAWETVLLPTTSTIVIDDINIGVYKNSDGTLKSIPKQTESVGVKNGIAGGNNTSNPIFAYGISQTGSGYIETAQLK